MDHKSSLILIVAEKSLSIVSLAEALGGNNRVANCPTLSEATNYLKDRAVDLMIATINGSSCDDAEHIRTIRLLQPDLPLILITDSENTAFTPDPEIAGIITGPFRIGHLEEMISGIFLERKKKEAISESEIKTGGKSLLVVDDDETFRTVLIRTLTLSGYSVKGATDGKMALEIIERGSVDTVITDVNMPHMDGLTLLNKIKKNHPQIPVILITGYLSANKTDIDDQYEPDGFLMKPFNVHGIIELLENISKLD